MTRVLFDARPAQACRTGIGRYAETLAVLLRRGVPGYACWSLGQDVSLQARSSAEEELELPALLEREAIDVYHSPLFHLPALLPCRSVITLHDAIPAVRPELTTPAFAALFERAQDAVTRADAVICPSEHARRDLLAALDLPPEKLFVVPEAPAERFRPLPEAEARAALGPRAPEAPFLLVVGSLETRKNPLVVLDALDLLPADARPRVVFAGPPAGVDVVEAAQARALTPWVQAPGPVSDDELVALYALAEALVFPSLYEGFGLPPLEAFACGTPVLASDAASIPEVVGDAALRFSPTDPVALAEAIESLSAQPALARDLAERGAERLERFTPALVAERLAAVYAAVCAQPVGGAA